MPHTIEDLLVKADAHDPVAAFEVATSFLHTDIDKALHYFSIVLQYGNPTLRYRCTEAFAQYCLANNNAQEKIIRFLADPEKISPAHEDMINEFETILLSAMPANDSAPIKTWEQELEKKEIAKQHKKNKTLLKLQREENLALYEIKKRYEDLKTDGKKDELAAAKFAWQTATNRKKELDNLRAAKKVSSQIPLKPSSLYAVRLFRGGRATHEREMIKEEMRILCEAANQSVKIRNMIVKHDEKDSYGEFKLPAKKETQDELVNRMCQHIENMIEATSKHIENMIKAQTPSKDNNEIIRLCFYEFAFYPSKEQGPLSVDNFNVLLEKITELAKQLPGNRHLLLGTFPVENDNIAMYVQCGDNPVITLTRKAIPSTKDLYYPGTRAAYFTGGSEHEIYIKELRENAEEILKSLAPGEKRVTPDKIDAFICLCQCNSDYPPPTDLITELHQLKTDLTSNDLNINKTVALCRNISLHLGITNYADTIDDKVEKLIGSSDEKIMRQFIQFFKEEAKWLSEDENMSKELTQVENALEHKRPLTSDDLTRLSEAEQIIKNYYKSNKQHMLDITTGNSFIHYIHFFDYHKDNIPAVHIDFINEMRNAYHSGFPLTDTNRQQLAFIRMQILNDNQKEQDTVTRLKTSMNLDDVLEFFNYYQHELGVSVMNAMEEAILHNIAHAHLFNPNDPQFNLLLNYRMLYASVYKPTGFIKMITANGVAMRDKIRQTMDAHLSKLDTPHPGIKAPFCRYVSCKTPAGAEIIVAIELCVEQRYGTGIRMKEQTTVNDVVAGKHMLTSTLSSILMSNTVTPRPEKLLNEYLEQIDPNQKPTIFEKQPREIKVAQCFADNKPVFGLPLVIEIYEPVELKQFSGDIQKQIEMNNQMMADYLLLKTLRNRNPTMREEYNLAILTHIIQKCTILYGAVTDDVDDLERKLRIILNLFATNRQPTAAQLSDLITHMTTAATHNSAAQPLLKLTLTLLNAEQQEQKTPTPSSSELKLNWK